MQKKKGISLIVLVITIIVMIILAAAVVITLSNTGVIDRASQAVNLTNESQVQDLAALTWADAYMDALRGTALETKVKEELAKQGVTEEDWNITVTDTGVTVIAKNSEAKPGTLGYLVASAADYGKTVNYTANGISNWEILYEDEINGYVFLISGTDIDAGSALSTTSSLTPEQLKLYSIFQLGQDGYKLNLNNGNSQAVATLIANYSGYANTEKYGSYVIGAIGSPTLELFAANYNAKGYTPTLNLSKDEYGYKLNDGIRVDLEESLSKPSNYLWLTSPVAGSTMNLYFYYVTSNVKYINYVAYAGDTDTRAGGTSIRPVVCLSSDIPAEVGTTTDFILTID